MMKACQLASMYRMGCKDRNRSSRPWSLASSGMSVAQRAFQTTSPSRLLRCNLLHVGLNIGCDQGILAGFREV
jgi:hypothetical protein